MTRYRTAWRWPGRPGREEGAHDHATEADAEAHAMTLVMQGARCVVYAVEVEEGL